MGIRPSTLGALVWARENEMRTSRRELLISGLAGVASISLSSRAAWASTKLKVVSLGSWDENVTTEGLVNPIKKIAPSLDLEIERIPFNQLMQTLEVRLGARGPDPDVYVVDGPLTASYASRGHLLPLDSLIDKSELGRSAVQASSYKGKLYSAPLANTATVLYFNKALFANAGLEPPVADVSRRWTWEKVHETGKALADKKQGLWGFAWDQSERPYEMLPLGQSIGGIALSNDGLVATGYMDSDPFVEAFAFMQRLYNDGVSPRGLFDIPIVWELFSTGKLAMMVGLTSARDTFVKSGVKFGVAPVPYFQGGKPVSTTGGLTFGINPRSANRPASEQFIRAIMQPEVQEKFLRARPYPPFVTALWDRMADYYQGDLWKIVRYEYENTSIPRPSTPGYREYEEILRLALRDIQMGSEPKAALTTAARKADRELQKYRS